MLNRLLAFRLFALLVGACAAVARAETVGERLAEMPPEHVARTLAILEMAGITAADEIVLESGYVTPSETVPHLALAFHDIGITHDGRLLRLYEREFIRQLGGSGLDLPAAAPESSRRIAQEIAAILGLDVEGRRMTQEQELNHAWGRMADRFELTTEIHGVDVPTGFRVQVRREDGKLCELDSVVTTLPDPETPIVSPSEAISAASQLAMQNNLWIYSAELPTLVGTTGSVWGRMTPVTFRQKSGSTIPAVRSDAVRPHKSTIMYKVCYQRWFFPSIEREYHILIDAYTGKAPQ